MDDRDYQVPFKLTAKLDRLTITVEPPKLTEADKQKLAEAHRAAQDAK